jgi:MFS family permease
MTLEAPSSDDAVLRAGRLSCACPASLPRADITDHRAMLAIGFGLAVLAQALVLTVLPEQSRLMAPTISRIGWPFALLLIGAAVASFPAAMLIDSFGRRAALALGAGLGAAGGVLAAFSVAKSNFFGLCLGAFWLGLAQGFALFYRHIAAQGSSRGSLTVLAGGAGAALATPLFVSFLVSPGAVLLAAAGLHVAALGLAVRMPHLRGDGRRAPSAQERISRGFWIATIAGAIAWFVMAAGMLHGPLTLAVCAAAPAFIGGAMGWHLFAMYGPAALAARLPGLFPTLPALAAGLLALLAGAGAVYMGVSILSVTLGLLAIGLGWGAVNVAALRLLHDGAQQPSRAMLALHDVALVVAATAGALVF